MTHNAELVAPTETLLQIIERPFPTDGPGQRAWCLAHAISFHSTIASVRWNKDSDEDGDAVSRMTATADAFLAYVRGERSDGTECVSGSTQLPHDLSEEGESST